MTQPGSSEQQGPSPDYVQSLARGLAVIRAFDAEHPRRTLSDVAKTTDLTRATARRFLLTLVELGYVRSDGSMFWLTPRVLELGYSYLSSLSLPDVAGPHLEALAEQVRESSSVSILDGDDVVYVARVPVSRIMTVAITIGTRFPAFATSMGRVLLAGLPEDKLDAYLRRVELSPLTGRTITDVSSLRAELDSVRAQGYCLVDQELEEGLRSIAAPVRDHAGDVVAAANVSTQAARHSADAVREHLLPALLRATAAIETDLYRVQSQSTDHKGSRHA
ncbi:MULTISPECIES: IclR family transcriptional regulator [Nocardiaceae]|uniref:IclR family transcriptional regulator n=1 Tax=Nocardiaceae TaxID=85025 RepID=UPI0003638C06|nr:MULTISPECIES: IclR family transcriptional regulator [Rhodococcus]OZC85438.1 IclR family transcriptional regulator [Rhodococcus sp. 06-418-1B]OZD12776.1 IclR family transcriptional regulator [Rhodococcus sp. 06-156-4C]OZD24399.1 IclR family transcriptional regulator [Rhodococcus sp. 06-156-3C]OZD27509.1 IclR family transcriptional regulator [Rhodococcus sp. 06-156-4a]OZD37273.1 IclR family transcriptional regulator [Rhodococcus sp. 06-156-3b]